MGSIFLCGSARVTLYTSVILAMSVSHESIPIHRHSIGNLVPLARVWGDRVSYLFIPVKNFFAQSRKDAKFSESPTVGVFLETPICLVGLVYLEDWHVFPAEFPMGETFGDTFSRFLVDGLRGKDWQY